MDSDSFEVVKTFDMGEGKKFKHAMLEMEFKFVNALWVDNTAYIKINNHIYWMEHHTWSAIDNIRNYKSFLY